MEINAAELISGMTAGEEYCDGNELPEKEKEVKVLNLGEWTEIVQTMNAMADKIEYLQMEAKEKDDIVENLNLELDQFRNPKSAFDELNLARYKEISEIN